MVSNLVRFEIKFTFSETDIEANVFQSFGETNINNNNTNIAGQLVKLQICL